MAGAIVTTNVLATTVAMGLTALRERLALVLIANRNYESAITAAKKNATVNVAVPAAVATRDVTPDVVPPAVTAVTPTSVAVTMDKWREAPFAMDDKGLVQVDNAILPMQASEAIKGLANYIEDDLWTSIAASVYGFAGVGGVTPFATDLTAYLDARKIGNKQLMEMDPRFVVLDTDSEANALGLRAFQDASFGGGTDVIINGQIGRKLGALWLMSQRVPTHTSGTLTGSGTTVTGINAIGVTTVALSGGASGTILAGDIIKFGATSPYTYNVVSSVGGATPSSVTFSPGLFAATAAADVVSIKPSFVQNLLIHRDCQTFAMAPLLETVQIPGATLQATAIDEVSGLSLRLEVSRQYRQYQWAFDALWGKKVIRANAGVFIAG
jgi:hypothetical protein